MVQLLAGIISLRQVREANPGRSHGSADTLQLRHSANIIDGLEPHFDTTEWGRAPDITESKMFTAGTMSP